MKLQDLTYGIVGLGIMGGSIAKAVRENVLCMDGATGRILACNRSAASLEAAKADGVVDGVFPSDRAAQMVAECDVVFVCLYPHATLSFLEENRDAFKGGSVVTDISGVKSIFEAALPGVVRNDVDFIIGHPMAGGEKEGYAHSSAKFFAGRNYILIPQDSNRPEHLELMRSLVSAMGFSRITETTCARHDDKIAFTSQLCHVIAAALVESAEDEQITAFGGGSFEDLTRIAMINAPLWTELFLANRGPLLSHIGCFERHLAEFKRAIEAEDAAALNALLCDTREKRMRMGSVRTKA
ncbi:MAG: prephenate dehydrogenase [Treponemataceae bacterium]|nr:prephenate dehydrogenase [Treponemataceae bacterium]